MATVRIMELQGEAGIIPDAEFLWSAYHVTIARRRAAWREFSGSEHA